MSSQGSSDGRGRLEFRRAIQPEKDVTPVQCGHQKCLQALPGVPWGTKSPSVKHCLECMLPSVPRVEPAHCPTLRPTQPSIGAGRRPFSSPPPSGGPGGWGAMGRAGCPGREPRRPTLVRVLSGKASRHSAVRKRPREPLLWFLEQSLGALHVPQKPRVQGPGHRRRQGLPPASRRSVFTYITSPKTFPPTH